MLKEVDPALFKTGNFKTAKISNDIWDVIVSTSAP